MDRRSSVVTIRSGGSKKPLFLCADVGGSILYARSFLPHIPDDRPVFGLRAVAVANAEIPHSFESIGKMFAADLSRSSFAGPYHLIGHSIGAYVAFETARQLSLLDQEVGLVALLDAAVPKGLRSPGDLRSTLTQFVTDLFQWLARNASPKSAAAWRQRSGKILTLLGNARSNAGKVWVGQGYRRADISNYPAAYRDLILGLFGARESYRLSEYPGRVHVYRACIRGFLETTPFDMGWSCFAKGGVEVTPIPGDHVEMIKNDKVARTLVESILESVEVIENKHNS